MTSKFVLLLLLIGILDNAALAPNSWQKRLDKALLDVDGARTPQARSRLIQRALQDPKLPKDISRGIDAVREEGMGKGHPELIDALWPEGTIAREDIEGIQALIKSLPERVEELRNSDNSPSFGDVIQSLDGDVLQRTIRESSKTRNRERLTTLAQNAFRRTPKSVNVLPFTKIDTVQANDDDDKKTTVQIQSIEENTFYSCKMENTNLYTLANMGNSLTKLTNSILEGSNYDVGKITSPFIIRDSSMYIWKKDGGGSQVTSDTDDISLKSWPACTLASIEFSGICTEGEIERQVNALKEALVNTREESKWTVVDDSPLVLQYNAPGTLPWKRKNQVAFVVENMGNADTLNGGDSSNDKAVSEEGVSNEGEENINVDAEEDVTSIGDVKDVDNDSVDVASAVDDNEDDESEPAFG